jgi:hypothetical protein
MADREKAITVFIKKKWKAVNWSRFYIFPLMAQQPLVSQGLLIYEA